MKPGPKRIGGSGPIKGDFLISIASVLIELIIHASLQHTLYHMPIARSLRDNIGCETVSKVFWKSMNSAPTQRPLPNACFLFLVMDISMLSVDKPLQKRHSSSFKSSAV